MTKMPYSPNVELAIVGVSRDCIPIELTRTQLKNLVKACKDIGLKVHTCLPNLSRFNQTKRATYWNDNRMANGNGRNHGPWSHHRNGRYIVFLIHATADKWIAKELGKKIEAVGAVTFLADWDINGGDEIPEVIRKKIRSSDEFLVLLTPNSIDRHWVHFELGAAWALRKRIVGILYQAFPKSIPKIIQQNKAINLEDFDNYLRELRLRVKEAM